MTKERLRIMMGENIRNERIARNMSIDELAEMLELTSGFVGLIERGRRGATPYTLYKISDIFGMPIDPLFYCSQHDVLSVEEEPIREAKIRRGKLNSMISDLTPTELEFVIKVVKGIKSMNHTRAYLDEEVDREEE